MTDFAELTLAANTAGLKKGRDELGRLTRAGADTERRTRQSTDRMGRSFAALGQTTSASIGSIVGRMVALSAAAIGVGQVGHTLAEFGGSMSQVQAITRATDAEMVKLRATAKTLGETTEFSAAQAADGLRFLGMAGFTASEGMQAIPAVLDLATASGLGLAQSADIASNVLSGFGLRADEAANVADVLAAASSRANTSVTQLGGAMSTAAPIAASLGIDLETTAAAIGVMSDAGIQGERAGTALRGILASLAGPTKAARDALAGYGLTAADVNPETKSLADIFSLLRARGLSTADAMEIFGREAASGALVMVDGSDRLREFAGELGRVDGEANRMADTMRDNLSGDVKGLGSAIQGLIIGLGDAGLTGALRAVVQGVTSVVRAISGGLDTAINGIVVALEALGVAAAFVAGTQLAALVTSMSVVTAGMTLMQAQFVAGAIAARGMSVMTGVLAAAMRGLGVAVAFAGGPIGLIAGLLSAGAAAFLIWDHDAGIAEQASYDAAAGTAALMGELDSLADDAAPAASAAVIALANDNVKLASSAYEAAKAELAKRRALLDMRNTSGAGGSAGSIRSTGITETDDTVSDALAKQEAAERALEQAMADRNVVAEQIVMTQPVLTKSTEATTKRTVELTTTLAGLGGAGTSVKDGLSDAEKALKDLEKQSDQTADRFGDMVAGIVTGANSIGDVFSRLGQQLLSNGISGITSSIFKGAGLGDIFAGLFDSGGSIPRGQFGIAGENGPEIVTGPARVTSRADTARLMGGGSVGGSATIRLIAPDGFTAQQEGRIQGIAVKVTSEGLSNFDRMTLPDSIERINNDPRRRG